MPNVYQAVAKGMNLLLGFVREDGKVYRSRIGSDEYIGRVDLVNGLIYAEQYGYEKEIGQVNLLNGKVYSRLSGPGQYLGYVDRRGRMYRHISMDADAYIGKARKSMSIAHNAAAMLLLVIPAGDIFWQEKQRMGAQMHTIEKGKRELCHW